MSLDALAPDQRAVVQLVLQQERSYDDLAGLLGISAEAVRERARAGLDRVGGPPGDLTDEERGEIADYLLGQQSVSRREATRSLLSSSTAARRWAGRVSAAVEGIAKSPLPGLPEAEGDDDEAPASVASVPDPEPNTAPTLVEPEDEEEDDEPARPTATAPVRARPRPRPDASRPTSPRGAPAERPRASKVGGALLLAGIALIVTVVVIALLSNGDDEEPQSTSEATPTATAEATPAAAGAIELKGVNGSKAKGSMTIFVSQDGQVAFSIEGSDVPASQEGEAYAVWLTGGGKPKRLGFAPTVGEDGKLGVSGPREGDAETFPRDFSRAKKVVVSRETSQDSTGPGPIILSGDVPQSSG